MKRRNPYSAGSPSRTLPLHMVFDQAIVEVLGDADSPYVGPKGAGGAAKVLEGHVRAALAAGRDVVMVACPKTATEFELARRGEPYVHVLDGHQVPIHFVDVDKAKYDNGLDNFLRAQWWFQLQQMTDPDYLAPFDRQAFDDYSRTNRQTAELVNRLAAPGSEVVIHDNQLALAGLHLDPRLHTAFFCHTDFPSWSYLRSLPPHLQIPREQLLQLLRGYASYDVTVFQTPKTEQKARGVFSRMQVQPRKLMSAMVTVDADYVRETFRTKSVPLLQEVQRRAGGRRIIGVGGRAEPYKNMATAVEAMLQLFESGELDPARDAMVLLTSATRERIPAYARYWQQLNECVAAANERLGREAIILAAGDNYPLVLAWMSQCDVWLTPAENDGCNTMPPEVALVSEKNCVQAVSPTAGIWSRLRGAPGAPPRILDLCAYGITTAVDSTRGRFLASRQGVENTKAAIRTLLALPEADRSRMAAANLADTLAAGAEAHLNALLRGMRQSRIARFSAPWVAGAHRAPSVAGSNRAGVAPARPAYAGAGGGPGSPSRSAAGPAALPRPGRTTPGRQSVRAAESPGRIESGPHRVTVWSCASES